MECNPCGSIYKVYSTDTWEPHSFLSDVQHYSESVLCGRDTIKIEPFFEEKPLEYNELHDVYFKCIFTDKEDDIHLHLNELDSKNELEKEVIDNFLIGNLAENEIDIHKHDDSYEDEYHDVFTKDETKDIGQKNNYCVMNNGVIAGNHFNDINNDNKMVTLKVETEDFECASSVEVLEFPRVEQDQLQLQQQRQQLNQENKHLEHLEKQKQSQKQLKQQQQQPLSLQENQIKLLKEKSDVEPMKEPDCNTGGNVSHCSADEEETDVYDTGENLQHTEKSDVEAMEQPDCNTTENSSHCPTDEEKTDVYDTGENLQLTYFDNNHDTDGMNYLKHIPISNLPCVKVIIEQLSDNIISRKTKSFRCSSCGKVFSSNCDLVKHNRIHTGEKPYICEFCNKGFSQKSHLNVHTRTHSGVKPFNCHICKKRFSTSGNWRDHMRIHSGSKPFKCDICDLRFTVRSNWRVHLGTHGGGKRHKCELCSKYFSRKSDVTRHYKTHRE